jgi:hypothetical protein
MSKDKKPKKLRRTSVPMGTAALTPKVDGLGSGPETGARVVFDYSGVRKDLRRIGVLAGALITILIALSFIIR